MRKIFTFLSAFDQYSALDFKSDLIAGLTVGVMLIPQGMAYAMIAGLPPVHGLYAAIFPPLVYAIFGSSRQLSVGPAAMDSMIVAAGVSTIAVAGSHNYVAMAVLLALLVGVIQITMGILRLGYITNFVSIPVINGFIYAVALTIAFGQLNSLFGLPVLISEDLYELIIHFIHQSNEYDWKTLALGLGAIVLLILFKKIHTKIPGGLIVLAFGIIISVAFPVEHAGVKMVGEVPDGLPGFSLPLFDTDAIRALFPIALTLAMVGFLEAFSVGKTIQRNHKREYEILPNREFVALGAGNIFGSFFGAFPTTGGLSRSAVCEEAGARSVLATMVSVLLIILTLIFLTPLFAHLPKAILSAIIFVLVLSLINWKKVQYLWNTDRMDFYLMASTFLVTLIFGIEKGVIIGVILSLLVLVYKTSHPHMAMLGKVKGTDHYRSLARYPTAYDHPDMAILRFDSRLFFANIGSLKQKIEKILLEKPGLKWLILDAQSISDIDSTGLEGLNDIYDLLCDAGVSFTMVSIIGPVRDKLKISGFVEKIGVDHFFPSISAAVEGKSSTLLFQTNA